MKRPIALSISLISLLASPAYAAVDLSPEKQEALKNTLTKYIEGLQGNNVNAGGTLLGYNFDGDIKISKGDGFFKVALPFMTYNAPDGSHFNVGQIAINATPLKEQGQWAMALSIPKIMTKVDTNETPVQIITIGSQEFGGVFHEEFQNFTKLKANYADIAVKSPKNNIDAKISKLSLIHDLNENETGVLSGIMNYALENATTTMNGVPIFGANSLSIKGNIEGMDISKTSSAQNKMMSSQQTIQNNEETAKTFLEAMTSMYFEASKSFDVTFAANDILMNPPVQGLVFPEGERRFEYANFSFGLENTDNNLSNAKLGLNYAVPKIDEDTNPVAAQESLLPQKVDLAIGLNNLPAYELITDQINQPPQSVLTPENERRKPVETIVGYLVDANTQLNINTISLNGIDYAGSLEGSLQADAESVIKFTADLDMKLSGLGNLVERLGNVPATSPSAGTIENLLMPLGILQMIGQQTGDGDTRAYNFEVTKTGQLTLNGADLSTILGAGVMQQSPFLQ